jgi:DNA (cytosine-5)-methyltransferase 1
VFQCEKNAFCRTVLEYFYKDTKLYEDIKTTDFTKYKGTIDIVSGGFPCQPFSHNGKRKGTDDDRYLWPEMFRAIREIHPAWVVAENVYGLFTWQQGMVFEQVQADLESEEYEVQPVVIPACGVETPHRRDRIWFVANRPDARIKDVQSELENRIYEPETIAHSDGKLQERREFGAPAHGTESLYLSKNLAYATSGRWGQDNENMPAGQPEQDIPDWRVFPTQSPVCSRDDGFPGRLAGLPFPKWRAEAIRACGNAIVPQLAYEIFKIINKINKKNYERKRITACLVRASKKAQGVRL